MIRVAVVVFALLTLGLCAKPAGAAMGNIALLGHAGGFCSGVAVSGQYAYVLDFSGFSILDISTPDTPVLLGHLLLPDSADHAGRMAVSGNRVYVPWTSGVFSANGTNAKTNGGFRVIDVSNPAAPRQIASYAAPGGVTSLAVQGNIAYVPWVVVDVKSYLSFGGFQILDISDPAAPVLLGQCDTGASMGVVLDGNRAYIPSFGGMAIVDVTSSASPIVLGTYVSPAIISVSWDLALAGNTAYFVQVKTTNLSSCSYTLETVDVSNPSSPVLLGSCPLSSFNGIVLDVASLALNGSRVFVGNNEAGLQVVDVSNATSPQLAASRLMPSEVTGIAMSGSTAYLSCGLAGLEVVNMSDPANPGHQRSCLVGGPGKTVIMNQHAYTCWDDGFRKGAIWRNSGGIRITSVPGLNPIEAIDAPGKVTSVAADGDRAYINWTNDEAGSHGIEVYDVHNPETPAHVGAYATPNGEVRGLVAKGNVIYFADNLGQLQMADLTDAAIPQTVALPYLGNDRLYRDGNVLYGWSSSGLTVLDVSSPEAPTLLRQISQDFSDVKRQGNTTFLIDHGSLLIYDRLFSQAYAFSAISANTVAVTGRMGCLGTASGVSVIDLINPAEPVLLDSYDYAQLNASLCAENGTVYASDGFRGLFALRYTGALSSNLRSQFDSQWTVLCSLAGLPPDSTDINTDGLPEQCALRLVQTVLDDAAAPLHETACTAYIDNLMELGAETDPVVQKNRECIAALLMIGADMYAYLNLHSGHAGGYHVVADKPFSGAGDLDHDGIINAQECADLAFSTFPITYVASQPAGGTIAGPATVGASPAMATILVTTNPGGFAFESITTTSGKITGGYPTFTLSDVTAPAIVTAAYAPTDKNATNEHRPLSGVALTEPMQAVFLCAVFMAIVFMPYKQMVIGWRVWRAKLSASRSRQVVDSQKESTPDHENGTHHKDSPPLGPPAFTGSVRNFSSRMPLLAGMGETFFSLLIVTWLPAALLFSMGADSPWMLCFPAATLVFPIRNTARRQWRRLAGNILGILLAVPIALYGTLLLAFSIQGIPSV